MRAARLHIWQPQLAIVRIKRGVLPDCGEDAGLHEEGEKWLLEETFIGTEDGRVN
jgi:hypothetical protein